jgi:hypothetical protein
MILYNKERVIRNVPKSQVCDMCKIEFDINDPECKEFVKIYKSGPSHLFFKDNDFSIDLCQSCLKKIVDQFDININEEF